MPFDGLYMKKVINEIGKQIEGPLRNVYQASKVDYYLSFQSGSIRISLNPSFSFMAIMEKLELPSKMPPSFTMLLRKHLKNARLIDITQQGFSRVAYFKFKKLDEFGDEKILTLVAEIMGKFSNLILVDDDGKIIDAHKRIKTSKGREIIPGRTFSRYEGGKYDPYEVNLANLAEKAADLPAWKSLISHVEGISKKVAFEICYRAGLDPQKKITQKTALKLQKSLEEIMEEFENTPAFLLKDGDIPGDFASVRLLHTGLMHEPYEPSEALKIFVTYREEKDTLKNKKENLLKIAKKSLEKLERTLENVKEDLQQARPYETFRKYGELLKAYHYLVKEDQKSAILTDWETGETIEVPLIEGKNPLQASKEYFEKYKKLKRKYEAASKRAQELEEEISYLQQLIHTIEDAENVEEIDEIAQEMESVGLMKRSKKKKKKQQARSQPRKFEHGGFLILVGKSNIQNERILREASGNDIWLHAHGIPGAHVIIKTGGRQVEKETLEYAASLAAGYSRGKDSGRVAVDYTLVKYVKKPKGSKPGMVIYRNYKTLFVQPRRY